MCTPFPASAVVDQGEVAVGLRLEGKPAYDKLGQDLRLRDIQLVVTQVSNLGVIHVESQPVIHDAEGERVPGLSDDKPFLMVMGGSLGAVAVNEARRVYGMTIQSLPANRSYTVGDTINPAGLVLQVQTNSGTQTITNGYTITPRVATTAGTQTVTVLYDGLQTTYTVNVNSAQAPRATAAPAQTQPPYGTVTPTPAPFGTPSASSIPFPSPSTSPLPFGTVTRIQ